MEGKYPTLYIKNLNEKINIKDLKVSLYFLFSQYGKINEIILRKNNEMRGQAFIVFDLLENCENALIELQNYNLFDKKIILEWGKSKSKITYIKENNFSIKPKYFKYKEKIEKLKNIAKSNLNNNDNNKIIVVKNIAIDFEIIKKLFNKFPYFDKIELTENGYKIFYNDEVSTKTAFKYLNNYEIDSENKLDLELTEE